MSALSAGGDDLGVMERPHGHISDMAHWNENFAWDTYRRRLHPIRKIEGAHKTGRWLRIEAGLQFIFCPTLVVFVDLFVGRLNAFYG